MTEHSANPAGRLWLLLTEFVDLASPERVQIDERWRQVLHLPVTASRAAFYRALAEVGDLPGQITSAVSPLEINETMKEEYLKPLPIIDEVLGLPLNSPCHSVTSRLQPSHLADLKHCSLMLAHLGLAPAGMLSDEQLKRFRSSLVALISDLTAWNTTDSLRRILLQSCIRMLEVLDLHSVVGEAGIEDEAQRLLGVAILGSGRAGDAGAGFVKRAGQIGGAIVMWTGVFSGLAQLPSEAQTAVTTVHEWFDDDPRALPASTDLGPVERDDSEVD